MGKAWQGPHRVLDSIRIGELAQQLGHAGGQVAVLMAQQVHNLRHRAQAHELRVKLGRGRDGLQLAHRLVQVDLRIHEALGRIRVLYASLQVVARLRAERL